MSQYDVKIFGERNTGTNAIKMVIETNSSSRVFPSTSGEVDPSMIRRLKALRLLSNVVDPFAPGWHRRTREAWIDGVFDGVPDTHAWKHTATRFDDPSGFEGCHVIFCVRHPYSWVNSLFKNPHNILSTRPDTLDAFIEMEWQLVRRDNLPFETLRPHQLYQEKIKSYHALIEQLDQSRVSYQFIKFEDTIMRQGHVFDSIRPFLRDPVEKFEPLQRSTKETGKDLDYYRKYYAEERWRNGIEGALDALGKKIDKAVFEGTGYELG